MLTDEQLEDLLRFEFQAGAEPDASRVIDVVTREVERHPLRGRRSRDVALRRAPSSVRVRDRALVYRWRLALPVGAVVATTSTLAGLGVFSSGPAALSIATVAYRTTSAVTTAVTAEIAYAHTVVTDPSGAGNGTYDWWSQDGSERVEQVSADGSPLTDTSWSNTNGTVSGREVDYASQTWHVTNAEALAALPLDGFSTQLALGHVIQNQLAAGRSENVQSTTLNGQPVLELSGTVEIYRAPAGIIGTSDTTGISGAASNSAAEAGNTGAAADNSGSPAAQNLPAADNSGTAGNSGSAPAATPSSNVASSSAMAAARAAAAGKIALSGTTTKWTVWVDPTTYLPVQMVETAADGTTATSSIQWLAPTSANLGQLTSPIPSGFSEVNEPAPQWSPSGNTGS